MECSSMQRLMLLVHKGDQIQKPLHVHLGGLIPLGEDLHCCKTHVLVRFSVSKWLKYKMKIKVWIYL